MTDSKIVCLLLVAMLYCSCLPTRHNPHHRRIVLHVSDSIENYISRKIDEHKNEVLDGLILDPVCPGEYWSVGEDTIHRYYKILLAYDFDSQYKETIIKRSNRYLSIKGIEYPIYILWVDDVFSNNASARNSGGFYPILYPFAKYYESVEIDLNSGQNLSKRFDSILLHPIKE